MFAFDIVQGKWFMVDEDSSRRKELGLGSPPKDNSPMKKKVHYTIIIYEELQ